MKRNRKQNIKLLALTLILLLGIGFAAIATQLKIEGTLDVAKTSWDVHLENVSITPGSVTANPAPTTDEVNKNTTEIAYSMSFSKPGDFYEFTVDMVNSGTIDAMVDDVSNLLYENNGTTLKPLPAYLDSTVTYSDGVTIEQNHYLKVNTTEKIKVRVEFKKDISISDLPSSSSDTMKFIFKADYKQADNNAEDRPLPPPAPWEPTFGEGTTFRPSYFAYDDPTTTDIVELNQNVFVGLDTSGNKGICIKLNGVVHCFQSSNVSYEQQHIQDVLGENNCSYTSSDSGKLTCTTSDFRDCIIADTGKVQCTSLLDNSYCGVARDSGFAFCN